MADPGMTQISGNGMHVPLWQWPSFLDWGGGTQLHTGAPGAAFSLGRTKVPSCCPQAQRHAQCPGAWGQLLLS